MTLTAGVNLKWHNIVVLMKVTYSIYYKTNMYM